MSTKPLKFPLELYDHPLIRSLNLCQAGLFRLLIESYWKSGIELPKSDYALIRLSNADYRTYKKYKHKVIEALNLTMPAFIEARTKQYSNRITFQKSADKARAIRRIKGQEHNTTFSDEVSTHVEIIPIPSSPEKSRFHTGTYDHVARKQAIESNKSGKEGWMSDD